MCYDGPQMSGMDECSKGIEAAKREARRADLSGVFRLAYVSKASALMGPGDLEKIEAKSVARNAELDITGILVMDEEKILQILEGDEKAVRALFEKILADPRHEEVRQVAGEIQETRYLSSWSLVRKQGATAPEGLMKDFHLLHNRLNDRQTMEDILPEEVDLLKVISLFSAVPIIR